jgi:hypothetical protein
MPVFRRRHRPVGMNDRRQAPFGLSLSEEKKWDQQKEPKAGQ